MLLDNANRKIQVFLAGAITTNQLPITGEYVDTTSTALPVGAPFFVNTNNTTVVDVVTGAASTRRKITRFNVMNQDTVAATITIRYNDNATIYWIGKWTLQPGDVLCYTDAAGWFMLDSSGNVKTVAGDAPNNSYRILMQGTGSHTAAKTAATYGFGQGDPLAVSGTGTLYPLQVLYLRATDLPTIGGLGTKLRVIGNARTNDVAPTGTYQLGLFPVTIPATSGGAGVVIYTIGTLVTGSGTNTSSAPAADTMVEFTGSDFAIPADGPYVLGMIQTGTVAASAHMHFSAYLQMRNNN